MDLKINLLYQSYHLQQNNSNINYKIQYFSETKKESKLVLDNDLIYILFKGKIEFKIYDIKEKNKIIIYNLFPKFSLILSHNTHIDYNIAQNTCLLTIKIS